MTATPAPVTIRSLVVPVYLPALLYAVGQGAIAPVIALSARDLGASLGVAGLVVALAGVGQLAGDLPSGGFVARVGERRAMVLASLFVAVALAVCVLATSVWMLGAAILATGLANAIWGGARHTYLAENVPYELRARAMSTLGGTSRIGMFIGPFLGAAVMSRWGTDGAYGVHLAAAVVAALLLLAVTRSAHEPHAAVAESGGTFRVLREHLPVFRTLGIGVLLVNAVRACRAVTIPLWADHVGLDASTTALIFGVAGAVDMLFFYPAGKVMDRYGRVWVAVPSMIVMALGNLLLPLTHSAWTLGAVALLIAVGNGMGSGIILTLGADVSPVAGRARFLGGWRLCADVGNAGGPVLISAIVGFATLGPAVLAVTGLGFGAAAAMGRWIPRRPREG